MESDVSKQNVSLFVSIFIAGLMIGGSLVYSGTEFFTNGISETAFPLDQISVEELAKSVIENDKIKQDDQSDIVNSAVSNNIRTVSSKYDHIRGNPNATISLIEYSDFQCPFCARFHPTAKQILANYADGVNWVYRHYPLSFHEPKASLKAMAVECANEIAGNDAFWALTDLFLTENGATSDYLDFADEIGVDQNLLEKCVKSDKYRAHVNQELDDGSKAGVTGTPGNIILNNKTGKFELISGAQSYETFKAAIEKLLE